MEGLRCAARPGRDAADDLPVLQAWDGSGQLCGLGTCGHVANADPIRRTLAFVADGKRVETTLLPHGIASWSCSHGCRLEVDKTSLTPDSDYGTELRIEHGALTASH